MPTYAEGTFPVVFESGVCVFDEDGTLHVHCLHTDTDPHPMATHPEGEDGLVPPGEQHVELTGNSGSPRVSGRFPRSSEIPPGLTFTFRSYQFAQLEASGDLSILVTGVEEVPDWFTPGKVHRFAREALAVCLHDDSVDPTAKKKTAAKRGPKKRVSPLAGEQDTIGQRVPDDSKWSDQRKAEPDAAKATANTGCLPLLMAGFVSAMVVLSGCTAWSFDLDECGATCGDGPLYLLDSLEFVIEGATGLDGFDLDGLADDCETVDGTAPDGATGIDNQFGAVWDVLPDAVATVIPVAIDTSLQSGAMMVLMEVVRADPTEDGPAALVFREGSGDVLVGADGRPLHGQTVDLVAGDNVLGSTDRAEVVDGAMTAEELSVLFKLEYLDTQVELFVVRGMGEMTDDGEGGLDMKLGGMVPLATVMELVQGLGGDGDANIQAALEALVPLLVDVRTDPDGPCDGISGAFHGHAVPTYLFED